MKQKSVRNIFFLISLCLFVPWVCSGDNRDGFLTVEGPCDLSFPEDHGPHPGYKTEWWYYTGNISDPGGRKFGFQLTFFRSQLSPLTIADVKRFGEISAWRTNQLILAHAALTDVSKNEHYSSENMARQALGMAGAKKKGDSTIVFLKNWRLHLTPKKHHLQADNEKFSLDLELKPLKKPVFHGKNGYSRKGDDPKSASCYYSFSRLDASGVIRLGSKDFSVQGTSWMDHEFSSQPLESDLVGWDWFSIQMDNNTELMLYFLRKRNGDFSKSSSGTFVSSSGKKTHLRKNEIIMEKLAHWKSEKSSAVYPSKWILKVTPLDLTLTITAAVADQEMHTPETTSVTYWEGVISVSGKIEGKPVDGFGYAELTGYAREFDAPM